VEGHTNTVVWIAGALAAAALLAALACCVVVAWLVRRERRGPASQPPGGDVSFRYPYVAHAQVAPAPVHYVQGPAMAMPVPVSFAVPQPPPQPQVVIVQQGGPPAGSVVLSRPWPSLVDALADQLRTEEDPVNRVRAAIDLGGFGTARSTEAVIGAVRNGVISPAAGAQAVEGSSFDAGLVVGAASADPDARVRMLAGLVAQRLERAPR